jgi:hypothetical protein
VVLDRGGTENEGGSLNPNWILDQSCPRGATKELGREHAILYGRVHTLQTKIENKKYRVSSERARSEGAWRNAKVDYCYCNWRTAELRRAASHDEALFVLFFLARPRPQLREVSLAPKLCKQLVRHNGSDRCGSHAPALRFLSLLLA